MRKYLAVSILLVIGSIAVLYFIMRWEKEEMNASTFYRHFSTQASVKLSRVIPFKGECNNIQPYNGKIYLKRYDTQLIVELDSLGNEIKTYGLSRNTGLSIFSFIISWSVDERGFEIVDGRENTITSMDFEGNVIRKIEIPRKVMRAIKLDENRYLLKVPDPNDPTNEIYEVFYLSSLEVQDVDFPSSEYEHKDFVFDGFFTGNRNSKTFHVCYKTGRYFIFDNSGKFLLDKPTVDGSGAPEIIITHDGAKRYHPLTIKINRSATATDENLYILSGKKSINKPTNEGDLIDVYEINTGNYVNSFILPYYKNFAAYELVILGNRLFALQGNYIVEYSI